MINIERYLLVRDAIIHCVLVTNSIVYVRLSVFFNILIKYIRACMGTWKNTFFMPRSCDIHIDANDVGKNANINANSMLNINDGVWEMDEKYLRNRCRE